MAKVEDRLVVPSGFNKGWWEDCVSGVVQWEGLWQCPGGDTDGSAAPQCHLLYPSYITGLEFSKTLPLVKGIWDVSALFITTAYESFYYLEKEKLDFKKVKSFNIPQKQSKHL